MTYLRRKCMHKEKVIISSYSLIIYNLYYSHTFLECHYYSLQLLNGPDLILTFCERFPKVMSVTGTSILRNQYLSFITSYLLLPGCNENGDNEC